MKLDEFEAAVLALWIKTQIPLTQANLQYHTGAPRRKVQVYVEKMVGEGALEMDSDARGDLVYAVPGATRAKGGPRTFAELEHLQSLADGGKRKKARKGRGAATSLEDVSTASTALSIASSTRRELQQGPEAESKSILLSAGLSLFFGPFGWFYAGSIREAIIGSAGFMALASILPSFLLLPLLTVLMPISGVAGLVYGWQHKRNGQRGRILGDDED